MGANDCTYHLPFSYDAPGDPVHRYTEERRKTPGALGLTSFFPTQYESEAVK